MHSPRARTITATRQGRSRCGSRREQCERATHADGPGGSVAQRRIRQGRAGTARPSEALRAHRRRRAVRERQRVRRPQRNAREDDGSGHARLAREVLRDRDVDVREHGRGHGGALAEAGAARMSVVRRSVGLRRGCRRGRRCVLVVCRVLRGCRCHGCRGHGRHPGVHGAGKESGWLDERSREPDRPEADQDPVPDGTPHTVSTVPQAGWLRKAGLNCPGLPQPPPVSCASRDRNRAVVYAHDRSLSS